MPMLATCYALHFTAAFLVEQYAQAKRTKEEELVADVHSLSAGVLQSSDQQSLPRSLCTTLSFMQCSQVQ